MRKYNLFRDEENRVSSHHRNHQKEKCEKRFPGKKFEFYKHIFSNFL